MCDVGQEEDFEAARAKALKVGAKKFIVDVRSPSTLCLTLAHTKGQDLREEFVKELIYPAVQANAIYEVRSES